MYKRTIVVNDIAASPGGGLTVLKDFYNEVTNRTDDIKWIFLLSKPYLEETDNVKVVLMPQIKKHFNRILFDSIFGARIINRYNPELVFSLQNTIVSHCNGKKVTYVHQPLPFQSVKSFSFIKKNEFKLACVQFLLGKRIKRSIRKSDLVIVQTKWMKEAVEKKCFVSNVKQIYPEYYNTIYKAQYHITNDFFYPTSDVLYKNNNLLVEAARVLNKEGVNARISVTISGADDTIQYLGRISHEEVKKRYANSCLVFPSYIETFGYPLVEARKAGSIILASDCEFSHELLDGYENAYFFNPFDVKKLVDLMKRVAIGEIKRIDSSDGLINNCCDSTNSWQKVIDLIIDEMGNCNEYI